MNRSRKKEDPLSRLTAKIKSQCLQRIKASRREAVEALRARRREVGPSRGFFQADDPDRDDGNGPEAHRKRARMIIEEELAKLRSKPECGASTDQGQWASPGCVAAMRDGEEEEEGGGGDEWFGLGGVEDGELEGALVSVEEALLFELQQQGTPI